MTPDLENTVVMTMDDLSLLYWKANTKPKEYTASDAIGALTGAVVVAGLVCLGGYAVGLACRDTEAKVKKRIEENEHIAAQIAAMKAQLGN